MHDPEVRPTRAEVAVPEGVADGPLGPPLRVLQGLAVVVVGALTFLLLLALVETRWPPLRTLELATTDGLNEVVARSPLAVDALTIVSEAGGGVPASLVMVAAAVWLLVRRQVRLAVYLLATGAGLVVLVPLAKVLVDRARPEVANPVVDMPINASFPSGHAMTAIVIWGALTILALPVVRPSRRRSLLGAVVALVLLAGFTRVALGVHFLTDVLAGWALGAMWLAVTAWTFRHRLSARHPDRRRDDRARRVTAPPSSP